MLKKILKKLKKDSADAVLVTVIMSMPAIMVAVGFAADMSKSSYVKASYVEMTQKSAETAVASINARGSLDNSSVRAFVNEFKTLSAGSASHTNETLAPSGGPCTKNVIDGVERDLPYMEVRLGTARGAGDVGSTAVWKIEDGTSVIDKPLGSSKYKVITADVYTGSPNFILGMFGTPCQYLKSSVSAISFGSNEDLK